ncbi:PREDICTED: uncharacterized protein LOC109208741 [Nicotiana attenuata]|uniref:uncharacterized protein LOC109208741 n=1 Tax=Nicotiana attenuata TaxID=49451 RepID=UPI000905686F|nr:PREDICTED: uncharacterized protein LOC109208741 [Nicotiana attenuata]
MSKNGFNGPLRAREAPRLSEYNFSADVADIVSAIERIKNTKWPRPLQSDRAQKDHNLMCKYHGTHGHRTKDCRQLREEVARLFNNGHLREFLSDQAKNHFGNRDSNKQTEQEEPQHVIDMIIGGVDVPQGPMMKRTKVSIMRKNRTRDYIPEGIVSFNDEDAEGIMQPHNDALLGQYQQIEGRGTSGSTRTNSAYGPGLKIFNMACQTTKEEITLPVNTARTIQESKFYVMEGDMRYNALFGRPWIHNIRTMP